MRRFSKKQYLIAGAAAVVVAAGSGAAYAYWTTSGTGTGSASTGTSQAITVNQTNAVSGLAPGLDAQTLSGNFDNPSASPQYVASVTITSITVTKADNAAAGTCDATDYTLGGTASVNAEIPAGNGVGSWTGLTIAFNDKTNVNQDACKGATVTINYAANAS